MDIKTVDLSDYKRNFKLFFSITASIVVASYIIVVAGYRIIANPTEADKLKNLFLFLLILLAVVFNYFLQNQKKKLVFIGDFEKKLFSYKKLYLFRLWWYLFSASSSAFLYILTGRSLFFFFALFDVAMTFIIYPNKRIFNAELGEDDIDYIG